MKGFGNMYHWWLLQSLLAIDQTITDCVTVGFFARRNFKFALCGMGLEMRLNARFAFGSLEHSFEQYTICLTMMACSIDGDHFVCLPPLSLSLSRWSSTSFSGGRTQVNLMLVVVWCDRLLARLRIKRRRRRERTRGRYGEISH